MDLFSMLPTAATAYGLLRDLYILQTLYTYEYMRLAKEQTQKPILQILKRKMGWQMCKVTRAGVSVVHCPFEAKTWQN
jgi:hypothetical protein